MRVIMFQPRFARLVEAGTKRQTIRPVPKRAIHRGDMLSLREWAGKPYRSKQREIHRAIAQSAIEVSIGRCEDTRKPLIREDDIWWSKEGCDAFARRDGFRNAEEMLQWFEKMHGLPFQGILITW